MVFVGWGRTNRIRATNTKMRQIAQFAFAGGVGYLVDAGVLMLVNAAAGPYWGRLISFAAAVITTWLINRSLTFRHRRRTTQIHQEFGLYALTTLGGGAVNLLVYSVLVWLFNPQVLALPLVVAAGSLSGMLVNYWLSKRFVYGMA